MDREIKQRRASVGRKRVRPTGNTQPAEVRSVVQAAIFCHI